MATLKPKHSIRRQTGQATSGSSKLLATMTQCHQRSENTYKVALCLRDFLYRILGPKILKLPYEPSLFHLIRLTDSLDCSRRRKYPLGLTLFDIWVRTPQIEGKLNY